MNTLVTIAALLVAAALQARLPALTWLGGVRLEFLPALVAYAGLTFGRSGSLALALAAGCMQDALSAGPFGLTALAYGIAALLIDIFREALDRDLPPLQMVTGALTAGAASIAAVCVVGVSAGGLIKIGALVILSAVITPLIFEALDNLRRLWRTSRA